MLYNSFTLFYGDTIDTFVVCDMVFFNTISLFLEKRNTHEGYDILFNFLHVADCRSRQGPQQPFLAMTPTSTRGVLFTYGSKPCS